MGCKVRGGGILNCGSGWTGWVRAGGRAAERERRAVTMNPTAIADACTSSTAISARDHFVVRMNGCVGSGVGLGREGASGRHSGCVCKVGGWRWTGWVRGARGCGTREWVGTLEAGWMGPGRINSLAHVVVPLWPLHATAALRLHAAQRQPAVRAVQRGGLRLRHPGLHRLALLRCLHGAVRGGAAAHLPAAGGGALAGGLYGGGGSCKKPDQRTSAHRLLQPGFGPTLP